MFPSSTVTDSILQASQIRMCDSIKHSYRFDSVTFRDADLCTSIKHSYRFDSATFRDDADLCFHQAQLQIRFCKLHRFGCVLPSNTVTDSILQPFAPEFELSIRKFICMTCCGSLTLPCRVRLPHYILDFCDDCYFFCQNHRTGLGYHTCMYILCDIILSENLFRIIFNFVQSCSYVTYTLFEASLLD